MIENKLDYSLLGSTEENPRLYSPGTDDQLSWKAPEERGLRRPLSVTHFHSFHFSK